jgi:hypothetical protein
MLINTHYPQVPISTSNVATDLARIDNQQRPPLLPPQEPSKGHEERAFNPKNERSPIELVKERQQQQQQQQSAQQSVQQEKALNATQTAAQVAAKPVFFAAHQKAALQRKDVHVRQNETPKSPVNQGLGANPALKGHKDEFYQALGQHVEAFYQTQVQPNSPRLFTLTV